MMTHLPPALAGMANYPQFICYVLAPRNDGSGKMDKLPLDPKTKKICDAHDRTLWVTAGEALLAAQKAGEGYGIAFVFADTDPYFFVDIDGAWDGTQWSPLAVELCAKFAGAAVEVSSSGKGLHIFGRGVAPNHRKRNDRLGLEFYTEGRFVALTGLSATGNVDTDHTGALFDITDRYFMPPGKAVELQDGPAPEWRGPTDDDDLIRRALQSRSTKSVFGAGASFADLWDCNVDVLSRAYPSTTQAYDASAADAALVSHLAFWTGRDVARIYRLMLRSNLARPKWQREGYLEMTLAEVVPLCRDVCQDAQPAMPQGPKPSAEAPAPTPTLGSAFLSPSDQIDYFRGCVYVVDRHRVLTPCGHLMKPEQFKSTFGGRVFVLDDANQKTTRNAWEAFTESQVLSAPRADTICFKPGLPLGAILDQDGAMRVNTFKPAAVARKPGDVEPFMAHLRRVLPDERDQKILLNYMAACVQYMGTKFQWCPVLQGCEGNGKTFFSACLQAAVGAQHTHWTHAKSIISDFNAYLSRIVFLAIEELYIQDHSQDVIERLKTIIAGGTGAEIQAKGIDQTTMEICCNVMATTNYRGAIRKTPDNARRFAVFYTAQQTYNDIIRSGMAGDYFPRLWAWAKDEGGFASVAELLYTMPIDPAFDPAKTLHRAPATSTTDQVVAESQGSIEQQILETIAQGIPGFMGGWVSSVMLDRLITETLRMGGKISPSRRRDIMVGLGYILHPGLQDGRTNNPVQPDGRKPQLWVMPGSEAHRAAGSAADIARAYAEAQLIQPQHA